MSQNRKNVIMEAFDKWDVNGDGHLNLEDLKGTQCKFRVNNILRTKAGVRSRYSLSSAMYIVNAGSRCCTFWFLYSHYR